MDFILGNNTQDGANPPSLPSPPKHYIPDESWLPIWDNVQAILQAMAHDKCSYTKQPPVASKQVSKQPPEVTKQTQAVTTQWEEKRVATMYDQYETAIKNGTEMMSCGRVGIIGEASEQLRRDLMKSPTGADVQNMYTICNDELCPMSEEAELKGLATLAKKLIDKNPSSLFNALASRASDKFKTEIVKVFSAKSDSNHTESTTNDVINDGVRKSDSNYKKSTIDDAINDGVKKIVIGMKNKAITYHSASNSDPSITPALIHITNHSWEHLKHILPILITSRSFFVVAISSVEGNGNQYDVITLEEDIYRCIICIIGALSEKASELFKKLQQKGKTQFLPASPPVCPYPQIVVVGTCASDEQHTKMQSKVENVRKWVSMNCPDSAQQNFKAMVVDTTGQTVADIPKKITQFITHDLKMPTPLSWELFRQLISYVTKNVQTVQLEKVASIASLCDITTEEFPSVLNFYHEHGAFLYYPDIQYLNNFIIIDPKWLQEKLHMVLTPKADQSSPIWKWHTTKGILIAPHCENPENIEGLTDGLMMLLENYRLVAPITIDREVSDFEGSKYFVPFVLKSKGTTQPLQMKSSELRTAPLHFIFPKVKYLPLGVFTYLMVALANKKSFKVDFKSEMYSNQIRCWFGMRDKVILSATLTSICVVVERLKYCGDGYPTSNFGLTCQNILSLLITEIEAILQKSFKYIKTTPAFCCTCLPEGFPHYVAISTETENTCDTLRCDENTEYTLNGCEQLWLKMATPSCKEGKLYESEINGVIESLQTADHNKLIQALEITATNSDTECKDLISWWSEATGTEARKHLMYHLNRLGMTKAAQAINKGIYCDKRAMEKEYKYASTCK